MRTDELDYELPPEAIAQRPLPERDASRLLVLSRTNGTVTHRTIRDLPELLQRGDLLVLNRSRVFAARLVGRRAGGGEAEVLLLAPRSEPEAWDALVRPGKRLRPGATITVSDDLRVVVQGEATDADGRRTVVLRSPDPQAALERHGRVPLPPYLRRDPDELDRERYQTVYAREVGSVAAPTAGLHFTPRLFEALAARGIGLAEVVLHVGTGTFRPIRAEHVEDHVLPAEAYEVPVEAAEAVRETRARGGRVVAVGTTVVRTLESACERDGTVRAGRGHTLLVIRPGHPFRAVDVLLTNFHLPRSSLLLLVASFAGRDAVLAAYREALAQGYRFFSYGDAMLVQP